MRSGVFMLLAVVLAAVVVSASRVPSTARAAATARVEYKHAFAHWMHAHNRTYSTRDEYTRRLSAFRANVDAIATHNANAAASFKMAINEFGDLTNAEYRARFDGMRAALAKHQMSRRAAEVRRRMLGVANGHDDKSADLLGVESLDWREKGIVAPIQSEGQCGACYTLAALDSVNAAWALKTSLLVVASNQQILDCSGPEGNQGCNGGFPDQVFQYIVDNKGICQDPDYSWRAVQGNCMANNCTRVMTITGFKDLPVGDETALFAAAGKTVVSIAIDASAQSFQFYKSGVFDDPQCPTQLEHTMAVVGYGSDSGKPYWIMRNVWGGAWGEQGYVRMVRGKNMCGLANQPSYAIA
jgi:cathepsin L